MHKNKNILFIGSFLSKTRGTKGISEIIAENLAKEQFYDIKLSSRAENKIARMFLIIWDILSFKGSLIHIDVFSGKGFNIALVASKLINTKRKAIILTLHGGRLIEYSKQYPEKINQLFKKAIRIQTPSKFLQKYFIECGYEIAYLPNPINLDKYPYTYKSTNDYKILWVRGFSTIYNPELAVHILSLVRQTYPQVHLTMVGPDRGLMSNCKTLAKKLGVVKNINFLGSVPNDQLIEYYQSHDIFLNTTSYESFGVAVVEAAASGIPIVSSKVGELPLLWENGQNILFVQKLEDKDFAQEVIRLLNDRELHQKLSYRARKKAELFSWERLKTEWIKLINNYERI